MKKVRKTKFLSVLLALAILVTMISGTCFVSDAGDTNDGNAPDVEQEEIISDDKGKGKDTETEEPKTEEAEGEKDSDIPNSSSSEPASQSDEEPDSLIEDVYKGSDSPSTLSGDELADYQHNMSCIYEYVSYYTDYNSGNLMITVSADVNEMKAYTRGGGSQKYYALVMDFIPTVEDIEDVSASGGYSISASDIADAKEFGGSDNSIVFWLNAATPKTTFTLSSGDVSQNVTVTVSHTGKPESVNYIANVKKGDENNTTFAGFTPASAKSYQENQKCVKEINVSTPNPQDEWPVTYITVKADLQNMKAYQLNYGDEIVEGEPRKFYNIVMNFNDDVNVADLEGYSGFPELENVENFGGTNGKSIVFWLMAEDAYDFDLTTDYFLTYQQVKIRIVNSEGVTVVPGEMHTTLNTDNNEKLAAVISDIWYKASEIPNTVWVSENIQQIIKPGVLQNGDELRLDYTVSAMDIKADGTVTSYTVDVVPVIYRNGQTIKITKDQMSNPSNLKVAFNIPVPDAFANKYAKADVVHNNTEDLGTFTVQNKSYIQVTTTGFSPFKITGVDTTGNASKSSGTVKTGDAANITLWMLLMALAAAAGIVVFKKRAYIK